MMYHFKYAKRNDRIRAYFCIADIDIHFFELFSVECDLIDKKLTNNNKIL